MYDTIIIGAGMSGLAAGIRLAYYDQRVCILERHTTIGGLNSFYRIGSRNYDVGLHAITNYLPKGAKKGPLAKMLRQLRFSWDDFALAPQRGSSIAFPGVRLRFDNDFEHLAEEVARAFPREKDNFRKLSQEIIDYDDLDLAGAEQSARARVNQIIRDPLLVEMLFCPLMYYGSARENDMEWGQFSIMFRSIFLEGFARPLAGVRLILKNLVRKFKGLGGELRLRSGVNRIHVADCRAGAVLLDDGTRIEGRNILSSAGWLETMRLCDDVSAEQSQPAGQLSFIESISVLDRQPSALDINDTIVFFNDSEKFDWQKPATLADHRSGVICMPNNFVYDEPLAEGMIRVTNLANFDQWNALPESEYRLQKLAVYDRMIESAVRFVPDFRFAAIDTDMFTPTTVRRYTGHDNGAIYGSPEKHYDGRTHLDNLFICGTDQGFVGIVGTLISGISIANRYLLK
ncbi:MAG: NAD(P)/FAD-dependent oxidoreductase [Pirellulales bacterium]|nr:NAD(P)/FAD-dependent oxidoreductase [Pirellulales bacterium]